MTLPMNAEICNVAYLFNIFRDDSSLSWVWIKSKYNRYRFWKWEMVENYNVDFFWLIVA